MYWVRSVRQSLTIRAPLPPPYLVLEPQPPPIKYWDYVLFRSVPHCLTSQAPPPPHLNPLDPTPVPFLWRYYVLQPNIIPIHDHGEIF